MYQMIGQYTDKKVAADAAGFVVEDRAQTQLGFETAEHRFEIGQQRVGAPQGVTIPLGVLSAAKC